MCGRGNGAELSSGHRQHIDVTPVREVAFKLMRVSLPLLLAPVFLIPWLVCSAVAAENGARLEDFEGEYQSARWTFSNGAEFPGAQGSFERAAGAALKTLALSGALW